MFTAHNITVDYNIVGISEDQPEGDAPKSTVKITELKDTNDMSTQFESKDKTQEGTQVNGDSAPSGGNVTQNSSNITPHTNNDKASVDVTSGGENTNNSSDCAASGGESQNEAKVEDIEVKVDNEALNGTDAASGGSDRQKAYESLGLDQSVVDFVNEVTNEVANRVQAEHDGIDPAACDGTTPPGTVHEGGDEPAVHGISNPTDPAPQAPSLEHEARLDGE